ncbi:MAG: haloacid dehalogenase type II [bacterium]|nr:haloacid dehalogenase type II [bacterium]
MKLADFKALTFDCYGTLIDWEAGIFAALQPLLALCEEPPVRDTVLEAFAVAESEQEAATPGRVYPEILETVHRRLAAEWRIDASAEVHSRFGASVPDWPAFPDSTEALRYLGRHCKLVILSNVDRASFRGSNARLGVELDAVYTAQDIGSYKPDRRNFEYLIGRLGSDFGLEKSDVLHTAQSLFHDHEPATSAGLATAWIDRRHDQEGWGATMEPGERPDVDFHFGSMADLVRAHQDSLAS